MTKRKIFLGQLLSLKKKMKRSKVFTTLTDQLASCRLTQGVLMSSSAEKEYTFEHFEEYYGDTRTVMKQIDECDQCGTRLSFSHLCDFKNLIVHETSRCPECGHKRKKKIHIIN